MTDMNIHTAKNPMRAVKCALFAFALACAASASPQAQAQDLGKVANTMLAPANSDIAGGAATYTWDSPNAPSGTIHDGHILHVRAQPADPTAAWSGNDNRNVIPAGILVTGIELKGQQGSFPSLGLGTSLTLHGLQSRRAYQVRIRGAEFDSFHGPWSDASTITITAAPAGLNASRSGNDISVSWGAVDGATAYKVRWAHTAEQWVNTNAAAGEDATSTSYSITGLDGGKTYEMQIAAITAAGPGAWSASIDESGNTQSSESTLSALVLTDNTGTDLELVFTPAFAPGDAGALTYRAMAPAGISRVKVRPTATDASPASITVSAGFKEGESGAVTIGTTSHEVANGSLSSSIPLSNPGATADIIAVITIQVIAGNRADRTTYVLDVLETLGFPVIADQTVTPGMPFSITLPLATGGAPPYTYSLTGTLPEGIAFDPATRVLAGTATDAATRGVAIPFSYGFTDSAGATGSKDFVINIPAATVPFQPVIAQATPKPRVISLTWTAPASNGGAAITAYRYRWSNDADADWESTDGADGIPIENSGPGEENAASYDLNHGNGALTYTLAVGAENAHGVAWSEAVVADAVIAFPPRKPDVTPRSAALLLTWDMPNNHSNAPIEQYRVSWRVKNSGAYRDEDVAETGSTDTRYLITGLINGELYQVRASSINANGAGRWSDQAEGTPIMSKPDAPAITSLTPTRVDIVMTWSAPGYDGGSAITTYRYRWSNDDDAAVWESQGGADGVPIPMSGAGEENAASYAIVHENGALGYEVQIAAENAIGAGTWSSSMSVDPVTASPPGGLTVTAGGRSLQLAWTEATNNSTPPVTAYRVRWKLQSEAAYAPADVAETDGVALSYSLENLERQAYHVQAAALNANGASRWSNQAGGTPLASTDATLGGMALSSGILVSKFAPATVSYTATVSNATTDITITPSVNQPDATVTVAGVNVTSGMASGGQTLAVGVNTIMVVVTAEDAAASITYVLKVTRAASTASDDATLSGLSITPGTLAENFAAATLSYAAAVEHSAASATVTPAANHSAAKVTVDGLLVESNTPSGAIALAAGVPKVIEIVVIAENAATKTYTLTITRAPGVPGAPQNLAVTGGNAKLRVAWDAPAEDNGAAITAYKIRWVSATAVTFEGDSGADNTAHSILGLAAGDYQVQVAAVNSAGTGAYTSALGGTAGAYSADVDESGGISVQDGIMLARYLLDVRGAKLTEGQSRADAETVGENVQSGVELGMLDIDADGTAEGDDGILITRYMLGLRGDALFRGLLDDADSATKAKVLENLTALGL